MQFPHEKLPGLDRTRVIAVVEPILRAHGVDGVEIVWQSQKGEQVLKVTVEQQGAQSSTGAGVTLETCTEISRDLLNAFDVADALPGHYRLEVGTPGLERRLYVESDYRRFVGRLVKLKTRSPQDGQKVFQGRIAAVTDKGEVQLTTDEADRIISIEGIETGRLIFEWGQPGSSAGKKPSGKGRRSTATKHGGPKAGR